MESKNIGKVAIVGGGVAGWMSAAFLAHMLGKSVLVTVIDVPGIGSSAFQDSAIPPVKAFHAALGIQEADLLSKTQGSMKLGTQFVNWGKLGARNFHPHGAYGAEFDVVPLHQWLLKEATTQGGAPSLDDLTMAGVMAQDGRFAHPVPDRRMIQSTYDYAYHMDSSLYCDYLRRFAIGAGVVVYDATSVEVVADSATGQLTTLVLDGGVTVEADLFLDCSGHTRLLFSGPLQSTFEDWTHYLPCDRAVSVSTARANDFQPFTRVTAREAGWQWRIPLQHRTSSGYIYDSQLCSDENALGVLLDNLDGRMIGDPNVTAFTNGRLSASFIKNVVAIGDAAGFLEPLEATSLHQIQSSLFRLLTLWPRRDCNPSIVDEFNNITAREWDLARDFLILHYHATSRSDSQFWRYAKDMAIPDTLQHRLAHWNTSGRLVSPGPEVFQGPSWLSVLVGQGMMPQNLDPLVDAREGQVDYHARLAGIRRIIAETSAQMPAHRDWIDKNCRGAKI